MYARDQGRHLPRFWLHVVRWAEPWGEIPSVGGIAGTTEAEAMNAETTSNGNWAEKKIFTTGEAAQVCKVSQQTIIRCFDSGRLSGFRVPGSKFRRIPRDELIRFMKTNSIPTDVLEGGAGKRRVLVVDDDPQIVDLFVDLLGRDGRFEVKTASTGYDAGLLTESFRPHLIILDYMLPDINGNVVCQRIRGNEAYSDTKIIFVSGVVNPDEVKALSDAGADDFVKKPFNIQKLIDRMSELLGLERAVSRNGSMAS